MRGKNIILISAVLLFVLATMSPSQVIRTGRSVGLAGSNMTNMMGAHARGWNPASLAMPSRPGFNLAMASFSGSFGNNAFTPQYISDTFVKDAELSEQIKDDILSKLDADRFKLNAFVGIPVIGVAVDKFAFNIDSHIIVRTAIPADLFRLALRGPKVDQVYHFDNLSGESISFWSASLSTAKRLTPWGPFDAFSVGATFKYLGGIAMQNLDRRSGTMLITHENLYADGSFRNLIATSGDGVGLDLGVAARFDKPDIDIGLILGNLVGAIAWSDVEAKEKQVYRNEGVNLDSLTNSGYWKRFFNEVDTTYNIGDYRTSLPTYVILGAEKLILRDLINLSASWYQGLDEDSGGSLSPRFAVGAEMYFIPILPLRAGISFGGYEEFQLTGGFGLRLPGYQFDLGASWERGIAANAQGFTIAVTNTFGAMPKR